MEKGLEGIVTAIVVAGGAVVLGGVVTGIVGVAPGGDVISGSNLCSNSYTEQISKSHSLFLYGGDLACGMWRDLERTTCTDH